VSVSSNLVAKEVQPTFSLQKLSKVESVLYGKKNDGALLTRVKKLEKELYGRKMSGSLIERANRITNLVLENQPNRPSLLFTINALEWALKQQISKGPIINRINEVEKLLLGQEQSGSISSRLGKLINYSLPDGKIKVAKVEVPNHTLVKIEFLERLSSEKLQDKEQITYRVADDLLVNGKLILPVGTKGIATVTKVEKAGFFGQDAKIKLDFNSISFLDNTEMELDLAEKSLAENAENKSMKYAVGASILSTAVLGPAGVVTGFFIKGEEEVIKPNQSFFVETARPETVLGIPVQIGTIVSKD